MEHSGTSISLHYQQMHKKAERPVTPLFTHGAAAGATKGRFFSDWMSSCSPEPSPPPSWVNDCGRGCREQGGPTALPPKGERRAPTTAATLILQQKGLPLQHPGHPACTGGPPVPPSPLPWQGMFVQPGGKLGGEPKRLD